MALPSAVSAPLPTDERAADAGVDLSKLAGLKGLVKEEMGAVNRLILQHMQSEVSLIPQLAGHIVAGGGKRVRPMLTLASGRLCGHPGGRCVPLAACVEFIHTATLLHDDVVDASELRRGAATANNIWGNKAPVLVGDFLFSRAFQLMVADGSIEVLRILSDASAIIAEGEVAQLLTANDLGTDERRYLDVILAKTATLFAAACEIGAVVAERPAREREGLRTYGETLGIAFQIIDDALDYSSEAHVMGKSVGDDFRDGKITLPVILAFARGDETERAFWRRTLEEGEVGPGDLDRALDLLARHGSLTASFDRAHEYGEAAIRALDPFPDGPAKRALLDLVAFCLSRRY